MLRRGGLMLGLTPHTSHLTPHTPHTSHLAPRSRAQAQRLMDQHELADVDAFQVLLTGHAQVGHPLALTLTLTLTLTLPQVSDPPTLTLALTLTLTLTVTLTLTLTRAGERPPQDGP